MRKFKLSLQAEILKAKNSLAVWLSLVGTAGIMLAFFFMLLFGTENFVPAADEHPWEHFFMVYYKGTAFMLLPLFAIIMAALVCFIEYRNSMWKHLLISTVSRSQLYLSKLLFTYLLIAVSHLFFMLLLLLSGVLLGMLRPALHLLQSPPDLSFLFKLGFKTLLSVGGMLALQFWISMRFRSFIVALGVGVIGFVLSSLLVEGWKYVIYLPYSYPLLYLQDIYLAKTISIVEIFSLIYCFIFVGLGLTDFRQMNIHA